METAKGNARWWSWMSCPRCAKVIVIETNGKDDRPHREIGAIPESTDETGVAHLPNDVEDYYRDAIRVMDVGVPDAAAVQLRRTLEAAAAHYDVTSGSLVSRIDKLIKQGLITAQFSKALHDIRNIGNVGAHATDERLDEHTVRRALRFTTQALRNLFEIPEELKALRDESEQEPEQTEEEESP